jgi:uncharacterized protein YbaP (TraB family)
MTTFFIIALAVAVCVMSYVVFTLHVKLETEIELREVLSKKVSEGETVIIENFTIVEKRFRKIEHEIKSSQRAEPKAKEALKAIQRAQVARSKHD